MTFSDQLRSEKKRLGLTLGELSTALDVSSRGLEHWLAGDREPMLVAREGALRRLKLMKKTPTQK